MAIDTVAAKALLDRALGHYVDAERAATRFGFEPLPPTGGRGSYYAEEKRLSAACDAARQTVFGLFEQALAAQCESDATTAENAFGGPAHTYASENADRYRIQDETCRYIADRIRHPRGPDARTA